MKITNKKISELDKILDKLVKCDSVVSINDFQDSNGNYLGIEEREKGENYFKDFLSVFKELNIANVDLNFLELTPNGTNHIIFKNNGGFSKHYSDLKKEYETKIIESKKEKERQEKKDWILGIDRKWKILSIVITIILFIFAVFTFFNGCQTNIGKDNKAQPTIQQENTKYNTSKELSKKEVILEKTQDTIELKNDSLTTETN